MAEPQSLARTIFRDGLVVSGPDALSWLQGQVSQDLEAMSKGETRHCLVLSPQGRVESFCRATRRNDDQVLLDVEAGFGGALSDRLQRFKVRVKVTLEPVTVSCEERLGGGFDALGVPEIVTDIRWLQGGAGKVAPDEAVFEASRILAGVPRLGRELTERTIPQEAGDELISRSVSFTKGCYTGQELVARLDARGANPPRRLRFLRGVPADDAVPLAGDVIEVDGGESGQLTSVAPSQEGEPGWVALGLVKRSAIADCPREVVVRSEHQRFDATMSALARAGE
ncbi:MAG: CAF17-like 4Fe-4S cluster assembly/insertion protein YgfZ [Acidimicrobiales bacterium]